MGMDEASTPPRASIADQQELIDAIGPTSEVARLLGLVEVRCTPRDVDNWRRRGIPLEKRAGFAKIVDALRAQGVPIELPRWFL